MVATAPDVEVSARGLEAGALEERAAEALRKRGWRVGRPARGRPNLVAERGGHKYVLELKFGREPRREILQALLADAILRARRAAISLRGSRPLAILGAPHITDATAAALKAYVDAIAPGEAFGCVDQRGLVQFFGAGLEGAGERPAIRQRSRARAEQRSRALFSDLNQWMLKVLLGQKISPDLIGVPREPCGSPSELAKVASVSIASAWRLVSQLEAGGFLEKGPRGLEIVRARELLGRWKAASSILPGQQVPLAWALPSGKSHDQLRAALSGLVDPDRELRARPCLGLFSACELLGVSFVKGAPAHMYLADYDPSTLERLGLIPSRAGGRVDVLARIPRWRESVFRAIVARDGVLATDVLQCWLDVSIEPTRGEEQADFLWRRVLAPQLELGTPQP